MSPNDIEDMGSLIDYLAPDLPDRIRKTLIASFRVKRKKPPKPETQKSLMDKAKLVLRYANLTESGTDTEEAQAIVLAESRFAEGVTRYVVFDRQDPRVNALVRELRGPEIN